MAAYVKVGIVTAVQEAGHIKQCTGKRNLPIAGTFELGNGRRANATPDCAKVRQPCLT